MSEDSDRELRQHIYEQRRAELLQRLFSNSEAYDQAVLTLSSALLGLSLAFVSDVVPFKQAVWLSCLYMSWAALALAVITTVVSFRISDSAIKHELELAHRYYLERDEEAFVRSTRAALTEWINALAGGFFILGVVLTIVFVVLNARGQAMSDEGKPGSNSLAYDGQTITTMQKVMVSDLTKGQTVAPMQQIPQSQPSTNQSGGGGAQPAQQPTKSGQ